VHVAGGCFAPWAGFYNGQVSFIPSPWTCYPSIATTPSTHARHRRDHRARHRRPDWWGHPAVEIRCLPAGGRDETPPRPSRLLGVERRVAFYVGEPDDPCVAWRWRRDVVTLAAARRTIRNEGDEDAVVRRPLAGAVMEDSAEPSRRWPRSPWVSSEHGGVLAVAERHGVEPLGPVPHCAEHRTPAPAWPRRRRRRDRRDRSRGRGSPPRMAFGPAVGRSPERGASLRVRRIRTICPVCDSAPLPPGRPRLDGGTAGWPMRSLRRPTGSTRSCAAPISLAARRTDEVERPSH
jgi:hypothetical protein